MPQLSSCVVTHCWVLIGWQVGPTDSVPKICGGQDPWGPALPLPLRAWSAAALAPACSLLWRQIINWLMACCSCPGHCWRTGPAALVCACADWPLAVCDTGPPDASSCGCDVTDTPYRNQGLSVSVLGPGLLHAPLPRVVPWLREASVVECG